MNCGRLAAKSGANMSSRSYFRLQGRSFAYEITRLWRVISREALADPCAPKVLSFDEETA